MRSIFSALGGVLFVASAALAAACSTSVVSNGAGDSGVAATPSGDSGGGGGDGGADSAPAAPFELTSSVLTEGEMFQADNTCTGKDESPDLAWGPGPEGTKSYAIVMNDQTLDFLHGVTFDIPATTLALPAAVDRAFEPTKVPGAKQAESYRKGRFGYSGPCAPKPNTDVYEFVLYALDVETLPNVTQTTARGDVETEIKKHVVGTTKLTGKYKQP